MNLSSIFSKKKEKVPHCSAVVLGAGNALRMGMDKMLYELEGKPVLARTLLAFERSELVDEIVVVTRADLLETVAELCKNYGINKVQLYFDDAYRAWAFLKGSGVKLDMLESGCDPCLFNGL